MAIFDAMLELFDNQEISNADKTSSVLDFGAADLEMGAGEPLWLCIRTGDAFTNGTNLVFTLYTHTSSTGIPSGGTALYAVTFDQTALTAAGAGEFLLRMPLPYNVVDKQYVALHIAQTGVFDGGTIDAWISVGAPSTSFDTQVASSTI